MLFGILSLNSRHLIWSLSSELPQKSFCKHILRFCLVVAVCCVCSGTESFAASNIEPGLMSVIWFFQLFRTISKLPLKQHICDNFSFLSVGVNVTWPTLLCFWDFLASGSARLRGYQSSAISTGKQRAYPWCIQNYASNWHNCNCWSLTLWKKQIGRAELRLSVWGCFDTRAALQPLFLEGLYEACPGQKVCM